MRIKNFIIKKTLQYSSSFINKKETSQQNKTKDLNIIPNIIRIRFKINKIIFCRAISVNKYCKLKKGKKTMNNHN